MKKTIKLIAALLLTSATSSSIVACKNPFADDNVFRITIVTDGHPINDHSFNESSYDGAMQFKKEFEAWNSSGAGVPDDLKNKKVAVTAIQPATVDLNTLLQSYGQAIVMDSKVTVASGFVQNNALVASQNEVFKHNPMKYIYVDGDTPNDIVPKENKNLAGLLYQAEQSGLMAALASGAWLIAHANQYGGINNLKMSTYGGVNIPAVTCYMYGFYWGVKLIGRSETEFPALATEIKSWVKTLNPDFDESQALPTIKFIELPNQYTGSFDQASTGSKSLNDQLMIEGTHIIFPVAGPQTSDTLAAIQSRGRNSKVVGVDTDQALQYTESTNMFLTSALKNINGSINYMLWRAVNRDSTPEHNELPAGEQEKIFTENAPNYGGKEFTGIADNPAISPIYRAVLDSPQLNGGIIEKVSQGWQKVVSESNGDYWKYGLKIDPFKS